jgi:hypothetical protein
MRQEQKPQKRKKYDSCADIIGSPEFKAFQEKIYQIVPDEDSIIGRIAKKKGLKLKKKWKTDLSRNIMMDVNEFYDSPENEL